jgi:hypothetical protein
MCLGHILPSFRGNRHMLRQTHASECTVKCSLAFVSPSLFVTPSVSVSESWRASSVIVRPGVLAVFPLIPWWQFPALPVSRSHTLTHQTLAARRHGLFKALSDHDRLYLKIIPIRLARPCANYWIACSGEFSWRVREIKLISILNVTARFSHSNGFRS